jgi:hypothetical protein
MIEIPVPASIEQALAECKSEGLVIRSQRELAGRPGSRHYHLGRPGKPGTLELNAWQGNVWFSVNQRRDGGWASDLAQAIAAGLAGAHAQESPGP